MRLLVLLFLLWLACPVAVRAEAEMMVRLKDVARFQGIENQTLIGYGLVIGLAGSGDSDRELTRQTISNLLETFNLRVPEDSLKARNCAAVIVTGTIRTPAHRGDQLDVNVATIGDASSLIGGELLLTPLLGTDGQAWAIAQGALMIGGFSFGGGGSGGDSVSKNHPTAGVLSNGAKLLRDYGAGMMPESTIMVFLKQADFTSAVNLTEAINEAFYGSASTINSATVQVRVPHVFRETDTLPAFISRLEQVRFAPDQRAIVVFNERTGTIVIGRQVRISSVAISHGSISISIKSTMGVSQPAPFARQGSTEVVSDQQTSVQEDRVPVNLLPAIASVGELVDVLNSLGVTPRDIMAIFVALRRSGALHAEIEAM